jgi:prophage antirepressor-like protein
MTNTTQGATAPTIFEFNTTQVRTIDREGEVWFVASDIACALEYRDAHNMVRNLDDDEKGTQNVSTPSGNQDLLVINESGLYHAILKSRKPQARPFRKWVTSEVLPAIRKTGIYAANPTPANQDRLSKAFAMSAEVGSKVSQAVFQSVMAGTQDWEHDRWLVSLDHEGNPRASVIERGAIVCTIEKLTKNIGQNCGIYATDEELARLGMACTHILALRLRPRTTREVRA